MNKKTVTIAGRDFTIGIIAFGPFRTMDRSLPSVEFNANLVAASLEAGGYEDGQATVNTVPAWADGGFDRLLDEVMALNGLKKTGEVLAGTETDPASTDISSSTV